MEWCLQLYKLGRGEERALLAARGWMVCWSGWLWMDGGEEDGGHRPAREQGYCTQPDQNDTTVG